MKHRNVNLFLTIADHIEKHPEQHEQSVWAAVGEDVGAGCGTAACIAGWAVFKARPHWLKAPPEDRPEDWYELVLDDSTIRDEVPDMPFPRWEGVGAHLLGLDDAEAGVLFDGHAHPRNRNHTWPDVLREIANGGDIQDLVE